MWIPVLNAVIEPSRSTRAGIGTAQSVKSTPVNKWVQLRADELLPVTYFHVVFTLPHELSALALRNKRILYELLFRMCSETLLEIAADPKHLGAQIDSSASFTPGARTCYIILIFIALF